MSYRFEFKYLLRPEQALEARYLVERLMHRDPYAADGSYTVTSLYFETPRLGDYYDKSGGFLDRKKIRARIYDHHLTNTTPTIWFEEKRKHDMAFRKTRIVLTPHEWNLIAQGSYTELLKQNSNEHLRDLLALTIAEARRPFAFIRYRRTPFIARDSSDLRITFDNHIEMGFHNNLTEPGIVSPVRPHATVMEVKFHESIPSWFGLVLGRLHLTRTSFSKYAMSIDAGRHGFPMPR